MFVLSKLHGTCLCKSFIIRSFSAASAEKGKLLIICVTHVKHTTESGKGRGFEMHAELRIIATFPLTLKYQCYK